MSFVLHLVEVDLSAYIVYSVAFGTQHSVPPGIGRAPNYSYSRKDLS